MLYGGNTVWGAVHFFLLLLIFTLVATSISHFLTAALKCSCYSSNEIDLLCFFISGSSSFSDIHVNVDIKIKSKEKNWLCCFFIAKSLGGYAIYRQNVRVLEMPNFTPAYMKGGHT